MSLIGVYIGIRTKSPSPSKYGPLMGVLAIYRVQGLRKITNISVPDSLYVKHQHDVYAQGYSVLCWEIRL